MRVGYKDKNDVHLIEVSEVYFDNEKGTVVLVKNDKSLIRLVQRETTGYLTKIGLEQGYLNLTEFKKYSEEATQLMGNLLQKVNPKLKGKKGIEALLEYAIGIKTRDYTKVESSPLVRDAFKLIYGEDIFGESDIIMDVMHILKSFAIYRLKVLFPGSYSDYPFVKTDNAGWVLRSDLLEVIRENLDIIFNDHYELQTILNKFADEMYSLANMMPCPDDFNTQKSRYDNPYCFYMGTKNDILKQWITDNMNSLNVSAIYAIEPPFISSELHEHVISFEDSYDIDATVWYIQIVLQALNNRTKWIESKLDEV